MEIEQVKALARDYATAGMVFLDQYFPGHDSRVDLGILDVSDGFACPLAQASGLEYAHAVDLLANKDQINLREYDIQDRRLDETLGFMPFDIQSRILTDVWLELYRERQKAGIDYSVAEVTYASKSRDDMTKWLEFANLPADQS